MDLISSANLVNAFRFSVAAYGANLIGNGTRRACGSLRDNTCGKENTPTIINDYACLPSNPKLLAIDLIAGFILTAVAFTPLGRNPLTSANIHRAAYFAATVYAANLFIAGSKRSTTLLRDKTLGEQKTPTVINQYCCWPKTDKNTPVRAAGELVVGLGLMIALMAPSYIPKLGDIKSSVRFAATIFSAAVAIQGKKRFCELFAKQTLDPYVSDEVGKECLYPTGPLRLTLKEKISQVPNTKMRATLEVIAGYAGMILLGV